MGYNSEDLDRYLLQVFLVSVVVNIVLIVLTAVLISSTQDNYNTLNEIKKNL